MRFAFVIRLGSDTRPAEGLFEGWIEEVDSCTGRRFRSTEELLKFLGQRFDLAMASAGRPEGNSSNEPSSARQKNHRKKRRSQ